MKHYFTYEVTTTQKCDMACSYCFEGTELQNPAKQRSVPEIIDSVYELLNDVEFMSHYNGITLNFWGGEPTQNPKMIIDLINEFKDSPIDFFMYTNGFNINNISKIINNFKLVISDNDRLTYQISYDGQHVNERVDHQGNSTNEQVLNNIIKLKETYPEITFSLKSTLEISHLVNLESIWKHFEELNIKYGFKYAPTLEYLGTYEITDKQLELINKQFLILAKKEIEHFEKTGDFVWSWFGNKGRSVCSAGANISNIDIDGNLLVCHGAIYSENKEAFTIGNVKDGVAKAIIESREKHLDILKVPNSCDGCSATVCYQCPIVNYDNSSNDTYEEKYHDPKTDLCSVYKKFGLIDRTIQKYLKI